MARRRLAVAFTVTTVVATLAACQIVAGLEMPALVDPMDGGADAAVAVDVDACAPDVPSRKQGPGSPDIEPIVFAVEFLDIATTVERKAERLCPGAAIDLDGLDTCAPAMAPDGGLSVVGNACRGLDSFCDPEGGGDSALQAIATGAIGTTPEPDDDPNLQIQRGDIGILLELTNYNGQDDDEKVSLSLIQSAGTTLPDGGFPKPDGGGGTPTFEESKDLWVPRAESFFDETAPRYSVTNAYVVGGVLVARFSAPDEPLSFGGVATNLYADEVVMTATIVREGERPVRLDKGRIALRIPARSVFDYAVSRLIGGDSVCDDTQTGADLRKFFGRLVCGGLDLPAEPTVTVTEKLCDAVSYASGFYATRARRTPKTVKLPGDAGPVRTTCPANVTWPPRCEDFLDAGP